MSLTSKEIRQILLLSLVMIVIPLFLFPKKLGFDLSSFSVVAISFELVFYATAAFFFNRQTTLLRLLGVAAVCLVSRHVLGMLFSLLIIAMYSLNTSIAFQFGLYSYLPVVLMQIIAMPFVLAPLLKQMLGEAQPARRRFVTPDPAPTSTTAPQSVTSGSFVFTKEKPTGKPRVQPKLTITPSSTTEPVNPNEHANGFDVAVRYIGEDGSVMMAAVVDSEGLLLGGFKRCQEAFEDLSPFSLLINDTNRQLVNHLGLTQPERSEFVFDDKKLVIAHDGFYTLMVISERTVDDVLNIRINQGMEMIRNYIAERYSAKLIGNAEKQYV